MIIRDIRCRLSNPSIFNQKPSKKKKTKLNARYADWECGKFEKLVETHSEIESRMKKKKKDEDRACSRFFFLRKNCLGRAKFVTPYFIIRKGRGEIVALNSDACSQIVRD